MRWDARNEPDAAPKLNYAWSAGTLSLGFVMLSGVTAIRHWIDGLSVLFGMLIFEDGRSVKSTSTEQHEQTSIRQRVRLGRYWKEGVANQREVLYSWQSVGKVGCENLAT